MLVLAGDPYGQLHSLNIYTKETIDTWGELTKQTPIHLIAPWTEDDVYFASGNKIINNQNG